MKHINRGDVITFMAMNKGHIQVLSIAMIVLTATACKRENPTPAVQAPIAAAVIQKDTIDYDTSLWTEFTEADGFVIDVKYATADNFVHEVIYPCGRMFLKPAVADALIQIRDILLPQGYRLKLFDGYRPRPVQQKLWDKVPDAAYVAPPSEGSMHNRGVAIDLTLTDLKGNEIDMGTPYDFFGVRAHHDYVDLPKEILANRQLLKTTMEKFGFQHIRTEWWHYSFTKGSYPLEDWQWPCRN